MPADPAESPSPTEPPGTSETRLWLTASTSLLLVVCECMMLVWMLRGINLTLPMSAYALYTTRNLLPVVLAGLVAHAIYCTLRTKTPRACLRAVLRPRWLGLSLVLFGTLVLLMVFYGGLKVMVPLLNERSFDGTLWTIDSLLLFGMSPNVFFVNLLGNSYLLRAIDWAYGYFFFFSVLISFPLFLPHPDDRLRTSFIAANVMLWSAGAWLYLAVPSLGPAYRYLDVWDAVRQQVPVSMYWQKQLIENYQMVLQIPEGTIPQGFSIFRGIGAFPSLHVGFQTLFALYLGGVSFIARRLAWLLVFLTFLGSILTGWHYMVDSIAGVVLAVAIYFLMERVVLPRFGEGDSGATA